jgi:intracellular septation protein A
MVKLAVFLGYSFASLGIGLFAITIMFIFASAISPNASTVTYPYRPLATPSLITGLIFFDFGIFGIWLEYVRAKRRQEAQLKYKLLRAKSRIKIS